MRAWEVFFTEGEKSWDRLCDEALKLKPGFVAKVVEGVDILEGVSHHGPIPAQLAEGIAGKLVNAGPGPLTKEEQSNGDIITINSTGKGNAAAYLTARLARDRPDILERFRAGDYKSVRAAAIAAGIIEPQTPLQQVQAGWRRATVEDRKKIVVWVQDQLQNDPALLEHLE